MDTDGLASRYRRAAASQGKPNERDSVGPATGRLNRDDAARLASAPTRAGKEIADPAKSSAPKDPSTRLANARTNAAGPSALAPKASTLRERALADPKRTRNFLKNSSPAAGATGSAVSAGLSYGMGWPACGAGVGYGCWDDNWSVWFGCYYGGGYPYYPYGGYYGWGCWPYSLWWWGSYWYPYSYYGYGHGYGYGSYGPTSVVVYQDAYPSTNAPA